MASIRKEISIQASPEHVWEAIRDVNAVHRRLAPGFVLDVRPDGDERIVTLANGAVVRELIVDVDDRARRIVWIADVFPNTAIERVGPMMEQGSEVMKQNLERTAPRPEPLRA